jgi:hypothetical protein
MIYDYSGSLEMGTEIKTHIKNFIHEIMHMNNKE